jgi:hypothetical protein
MEYDDANRLIKYNGEAVLYDEDGNMTYAPDRVKSLVKLVKKWYNNINKQSRRWDYEIY